MASSPPKSAQRRIQTRRSGVHGKGVFALQDIAEGETIIEYVGEIISWEEMLKRLLEDNERVLAAINTCYHIAEKSGNHGLSNLMAERQDAHKKHGWMMRATLKSKVTRFPTLSTYDQS